MTIVATDSSCDLNYLLKDRNIPFIPIYVIMNGEEYHDGIDITPEDIFKNVKETKKLPKTSALSENDYEEFFKKLTANGDDVVYIGLSSKLSTSYNNSINAAKKFNGKVHIVDGKNLSTGTGLSVLYAKDLADKGLPADEIAKKVEERVPFVQASFIIQEVEYLWRGGRLSTLSMLGANLLKIKPQIEVIDGEMKNTAKPRGKMVPVLKEYIDRMLATYNNPDTTRCFITHSSIEPEIAEEMVNYVKSKGIFKEVYNTVAGATITSHCGKGTLGILYINDGDHE